jgi:PKD repeat protein
MKKGLLFFFSVFTMLGQGYAAQTQQLKLEIADVTTFLYDRTSIYFDQGLSTTFVPLQDIIKPFNPDTAIPQLYSISSDDSLLFSNGYGEFSSCIDVPLGFRVQGGSSYRISIYQVSNFSAASIIQLEDRTLGVFHNLLSSDYIVPVGQFAQSDTRFVLHISYPPSFTTVAAGCNNDDGIITVNQDCIAWTKAELFFGSQSIHSFTNATGAFSFTGLEEGAYTVALTFGNYTTTLPVTLVGHQIQARIDAPLLNAVTGQTMQFSAITTNATGFHWDFGDGTELTGMANPDYAYLEPGTYTVTLTATNSFGCSYTATVTVVIAQGTGINTTHFDAANIFCQRKNLVILSSQPLNGALNIYSIEGEKVFQSSFEPSRNYDLSLLADGIYIVTLTSRTNSFSKKLFLQE